MAKKNDAANSTSGETQVLEFANSNLSLEMLTRQATVLLTTKNLVRIVRELTPGDQAKFLDKLDQAYHPLDWQNVKYVTALGNLCSEIQQLPTSTLLTTGLEKRGNIAVASGGTTDIWRGELGDLRVAIKAFRIYPAQDLKEAKEILWKRVPVWMRLSHPNILPFRGVNTTLFQLSLAYNWGANGNITQFIASHPRASRSSLLLGVAEGLEYLHSLGILHGDLKGANVVIDRRGCARLTEYGLAPIYSDSSFTVAATPGSVGTSRLLAPELMIHTRKGGSISVMESKAADVFAFGMLAVEVFTGKIPFEERKNQAVVHRISQGGRPGMPGHSEAVGLTVEIWNLLESCWQQDPKKRPAMEGVVRRWRKFLADDDSVLFPENPAYAMEPGEGISRRRARTVAVQPRMKSEVTRHRTMSENVGPRKRLDVRLRTSSAVVKRETPLGVIPERPNVDVFPRIPRSEVPKPRPAHDTLLAPKAKKVSCLLM